MLREGDYQGRVEEWQNAVFGQPDLVGRLEKVEEEACESTELLEDLSEEEINAIPENDPALARQLAEELTDGIIASLGAISVLGFRFSELFDSKLEIMQEKYHPEKIAQHVASGLTPREAMAQAKTIWEFDKPRVEG